MIFWSKDASETASCLQRFLSFSEAKTRNNRRGNVEGLIAQKRTESQKELCLEKKGYSLNNRSKLSTSRLVHSRKGDVLQRARQDGQRQDGARRTNIFFRVQVSCKLVSHKDERRTHQFGKKILHEVFLGEISREESGWLGDLQRGLTDQPDRRMLCIRSKHQGIVLKELFSQHFRVRMFFEGSGSDSVHRLWSRGTSSMKKKTRCKTYFWSASG